MAPAIGIRRREPRLTGFQGAAKDDGRTNSDSRPEDAEADALDRRPTQTLTRKLLAINLVPLALFLAGLLYLDNYREGLIAAKIDSLSTHGQVIAGALGETVVAVGLDDATQPPITHIMGTQARSLIRRVVVAGGTRARLFQATGELIADSRELIGVGGLVQSEILPPPGDEAGVEGWLRKVDLMVLGIVPVFSAYEPYIERADQKADHYSELSQALVGEIDHALRDAGRDGLMLTVAVPVSHYRQVQGVLLLSSNLDDVEAELRAVRSDILVLALIAFVATVLLSLYLASTIARPIRRLAEAADDVRFGYGEAESIPDFGARGDEIGELSRALIDMTHALEQRMTATEQFAADVAHEIKNPLSSLKSAVETLPKIEDEDRRKTLMRIATDDLRRIDRLITDISDASRLDAELSRATTEPVDLGQLLEALATVLRTTWGEDGPFLELGPELDREEVAGRFMVQGVEDRLVQVIRNLLTNARSFSPEDGTVTITCTASERWIDVRISDQGPGITKGKEDEIFKRFYSDRPSSEKFGTHSGLGLSISRQIIEAHGGTLKASNLGDDPDAPEGACFRIRLPARRGA
ncbi:MAG: histidine kinase [Rhodospirillaceae bacterium]|nr:histidine kinase [Rhodospirillaceae bacterium]|tara:strand:+ start:4218 stop:5966 length:1749 start_codon:yes stop_codon:yes gene_type:complete